MKHGASAFLAALFFVGATPSGLVPARIVSLDGTTTEIVAALGARDELVGRDDSSTYPADVTHLPSVGYQFALSAEGILSLHPTLVIGREDVQPATVVQQVREAGVRVELVPTIRTIEGVEQKIRTIAQLLNRTAQGSQLIAGLQRDNATLQREIAARGNAPRACVLVFLTISQQMTLACGPESGPGAMVGLAGATNALPTMHGCKPATPEAIVGAAPDVIVALARGADYRLGAPSLAQLSAVAQTPAGRANRLYTFDGLFFAGFGPRTGRALLDLFDAIYRTH